MGAWSLSTAGLMMAWHLSPPGSADRSCLLPALLRVVLQSRAVSRHGITGMETGLQCRVACIGELPVSMLRRFPGLRALTA